MYPIIYHSSVNTLGICKHSHLRSIEALSCGRDRAARKEARTGVYYVRSVHVEGCENAEVYTQEFVKRNCPCLNKNGPIGTSAVLHLLEKNEWRTPYLSSRSAIVSLGDRLPDSATDDTLAMWAVRYAMNALCCGSNSEQAAEIITGLYEALDFRPSVKSHPIYLSLLGRGSSVQAHYTNVLEHVQHRIYVRKAREAPTS